MKTVQLTNDDLTELKILRNRLELDRQNARLKSDNKAQRQYGKSHIWSPLTSDEERDAEKAVVVLNKILK